MNAIILTMGLGERMRPWTRKTNKVLFHVDGEPLITYHARRLRLLGARVFVIVPRIEPELAEIAKEYGLKLCKEDLGLLTGGAVRKVMDDNKLKRAVVVYGDTWFPEETYMQAYTLFNSKRNHIFVNDAISYSNGLVKYSTRNLRALEVKETGGLSRMKANQKACHQAGILVVNRSVLTKKRGDIMRDILPNSNDLYVTKTRKSYDIGTLEDYIFLTLKNYDNRRVNDLLIHDETTRERRPSVETLDFIMSILFADRIFLCGNGGSMSTASHLALDWSKVGKKNAIALGNPDMITAYANDEGYRHIFADQLARHRPTKKDVIVLLSGSGSSQNVTSIMYKYKENVLAMCARRGLLMTMSPALRVNSDDIRVIEDTHLAYGHAITAIMEGLRP